MLRQKLLVVMVLVASLGRAEELELFNYCFSEKGLSSLVKLEAIAASYHGRFELPEDEKYEMRRAGGEDLVVDGSGIYLEKNKILSITRETVREDSKYTVRNGWLIGVVENDSVRVVLEGEKYFFLIPSKTYLFEVNSASNRLFSNGVKDEFFIATEVRSGHFEVIGIRLSSGGVELKELTWTKQCTLQMIKDQEEIKKHNGGDYSLFILSPTKDEWKGLSGCFQTYDSYVKKQ